MKTTENTQTTENQVLTSEKGSEFFSSRCANLLNDILDFTFDKSDNSDIDTRVKQFAVTTSNLTAGSFVGFSNAAYSDGNTATITYNSGGANIGYCTSPTGDITLSVTGIPTTGFDNQALTFSVIVDNSTANAAGVRTCNAVKLNHVTKTIRWSGGSVGTGNTAAYDIFNFTGINTIGSGTTAANYEVFGLVNGDFRLY